MHGLRCNSSVPLLFTLEKPAKILLRFMNSYEIFILFHTSSYRCPTVPDLFPMASLSKKSKVRPNSHRTQTHINVRKPNNEKADPGKQHMTSIQAADAAVCFFADRFV